MLTGNDQTVAARPWREIETEDHNLKGWVQGDFLQALPAALSKLATVYLEPRSSPFRACRSSPPPDRFQREIDDIIRLAERRLEHQSFSYRMRRSTGALATRWAASRFSCLPPETLGGWGLALLLISWLLTLPIIDGSCCR